MGSILWCTMKADDTLDLLQSFVHAFGPCGQEEEVRTLCQQQLSPLVDDMWIDPAGNLIGKVSGKNQDSSGIRLMMHMDEISLIVKRVNEDGSLRVNPLGGIFAFSFGQGPVDILGDKEHFSGILSFGCAHTTKESATINKMLPEDRQGLGKTPDWEDVVVITRKTAQELKNSGVHAGTRVVISRTRRKLHFFQDCVAGYFLDDRAALVVALTALKRLKKAKKKPLKDLYFVATSCEEIGAHGASYAARTLPGDTILAVDVAPVAKEYQTILNSSPVVVYQDGCSLYDKKISDQLMHIGHTLGLSPQAAVLGRYGSDASLSQSRGQSAKAALLCFPVENTHGFEITHTESIHNCALLLETFLSSPSSI